MFLPSTFCDLQIYKLHMVKLNSIEWRRRMYKGICGRRPKGKPKWGNPEFPRWRER